MDCNLSESWKHKLEWGYLASIAERDLWLAFELMRQHVLGTQGAQSGVFRAMARADLARARDLAATFPKRPIDGYDSAIAPVVGVWAEADGAAAVAWAHEMGLRSQRT